MNNFFIQSDIDEISQRLSDLYSLMIGKTMLITGGRGFVGRYFLQVFKNLNENYLEEPIKIISIDNFITSGRYKDSIAEDPNIKFIEHNVIEPYNTNQEIDYIVHAAGIASPHYYRIYPLETLEVAITGTKNMLKLAKEKKAKLIFFSSSEIYGDPAAANIPTKETYRGNVTTLGPRSCYDESKRIGETLCYIFQNHYGVLTNIVRPFNFYGPGMQENDYRVLPNFAHNIKAKYPLKIYGKGTQTRTFCYITDAITGLLKIILKGKPDEVYNIGNSEPEISMIELVHRIEKVLGKKIPYEIVNYPGSYPPDEPNRRCPDLSKIQNHLGYTPKVNLDEGLYRFFSWTNENYSGI